MHPTKFYVCELCRANEVTLYLLSEVATGTLLLRRKALDTTRYFDENLLCHQDMQLLVDFTSKYKLKEIDKHLHCVDVSDVRNRPGPEKLIKHNSEVQRHLQWG